MEPIWLRNNGRVRIASYVLLVDGLGMLVLSALLPSLPHPARLAIALAGGVSLWISLALAYLNAGARLAYVPGYLLVRFGWNARMRLPVDIVEVILTGSESIPPAVSPAAADLTTRNVVIRLAERAFDWHFREIPAVLGQWRDGYIVIRGLWCEPVTKELLLGLNDRLVQAKRALAKDPSLRLAATDP